MRFALVLAVLFAPLAFADDGQKLLTIDHYVRIQSTVPAIAGQPAQVYVRERVQAGTALRDAKGFRQIFHEDLGHSACHC